MAPYAELIDRTEDRILAGVQQIQDVIVTATGTVAQTVAERLPELPQLPLAAAIPAPEWIVRKWFEVAERAFENQKSFATSMIKAMAPVTAKIEGRVVGKAPRKASRPAARAS